MAERILHTVLLVWLIRLVVYKSVRTARSRPLGGSVDRIGVALLAALVALAELGWFIAAERMTGMDSGPGTNPGALGFFLPVWVVGMAVMMFPSISPMVAVMSGFRFADAGLRAPR